MAIGYEQTLAYLTQKEPELTVQQAERLREAAQELCDSVQQAAAQLREAREKAEGLARQAGFASLETMVKALGLATIREQAAEMRQVKAKSIVVRKPYMTLEGDRIYSCASHHAVPPALQTLLNKGYAKTELHYRNIAAAATARGIQLGFDPVERHRELAALERQ